MNLSVYTSDNPPKDLYDMALRLGAGQEAPKLASSHEEQKNAMYGYWTWGNSNRAGWRQQSIGWGRDAHIGTAWNDAWDRPVLIIGHRYAENRDIYGSVLISADGHFYMQRPPHGNKQRYRLARASFLDWMWTPGGIAWFPHLDHETVIRAADEKDPRLQVNYVRQWTLWQRWLKLVPDPVRGWDFRWASGPFLRFPDPWSDEQNDKAGCGGTPEGDWSRQIRLRERRYRLAMAERGPNGKIIRRAPATLRRGNQTLDPATATQALVALLDVTAPAKSTPRLLRPTEARERIS